MEQFLQASVNGLLHGGLYALIAVGFSLVWGVMHVVNIAHGAFVIIGAYISWKLQAATGLDPLLGMLIAAVALFGFGYVVQRNLINRVINAPIWMTLLLTFGMELLLVNALIIVFTGDYRSIQTSFASGGIDMGAVRVPFGRLLAFGLAIALTTGLAIFIARTRAGQAIRATGMDRVTARLMGISAAHIYALTFGISAALAAAAGTMVGIVGTFSPIDAGTYTLRSFVISVLGGLGNMWGALAGGLLLGLVEAWGGQYIAGTLVNAIAFAVLIIVLLVRPSGLLGRPFYEARAEV
ncbi:MAG: branched-chain amino acid ABC transporter permease [Candidatus Limnocylindria bacterium]